MAVEVTRQSSGGALVAPILRVVAKARVEASPTVKMKPQWGDEEGVKFEMDPVNFKDINNITIRR